LDGENNQLLKYQEKNFQADKSGDAQQFFLAALQMGSCTDPVPLK